MAAVVNDPSLRQRHDRRDAFPWPVTSESATSVFPNGSRHPAFGARPQPTGSRSAGGFTGAAGALNVLPTGALRTGSRSSRPETVTAKMPFDGRRYGVLCP